MAKKKEDKTPSVVMIGSPGRDAGGLLSLVLATALADAGLIKLAGMVATGGDGKIRPRQAMLAKGALIALGHLFVPVSFGSDYVSSGCDEHFFDSDGVLEQLGSTILRNPQQLLQSVFAKAEPKSITVVISAPMGDLVTLLKNNNTMPFEALEKVVVLGGVAAESDETGMFRPNPAVYPNCENLAAAEELFYLLQRNNIRTIVLPTSSLPKVLELKQPLAECNNLVAKCLQNMTATEIDAVWLMAAACGEWKKFGSLERMCDPYRMYVAKVEDVETAREWLMEQLIKTLQK